MDQLMADIAIGGDIKNVVHRDDLTWPEVVLMRDIHGDLHDNFVVFLLGQIERKMYENETVAWLKPMK